MAGGNPPSSVSPSSNLNSVSSVPTNQLSNNFTSSNISNVDSSINNAPSSVNSSVNTPLVNSSSQSQTQNFFPSFGIANPLNKSALSKQFLYQMHLLESAYRHPIIPLDSHRLKWDLHHEPSFVHILTLFFWQAFNKDGSHCDNTAANVQLP